MKNTFVKQYKDTEHARLLVEDCYLCSSINIGFGKDMKF
jgi:hypothetical protein